MIISMKDIIYDNGFPANIDKNKLVVIQITKKWQSVVLYTDFNGQMSRCFLPYEIGKFDDGIYMVNFKKNSIKTIY